MTRENKLALIIGFALVLIVGILLSDHFSAASREAAADLAGQDVASGNRFADAGSLMPVEMEGGADRGSRTSISPTPALTSTEVGRLPNHRDVRDVSAERGDGASADSMIDVQDESPFLHEISNVNLQDPQFNPRVQQDTAAAGFQWYSIQPGETLSKICSRVYGDVDLWPRLAEFNKDRIANPNQVPSGVTIRLPERDLLLNPTRVASDESAGDADRAAARSDANAASSADSSTKATGGFVEYTIEKGDTLGEIASKFLGTSRRYMEIYELNKDKIPSPDRVIVGRTIRIPKSS